MDSAQKELKTSRGQRPAKQWDLLSVCKPRRAKNNGPQSDATANAETKANISEFRTRKPSIVGGLRRFTIKMRYELPTAFSLKMPWPQEPQRRFNGYEWMERRQWSIPLRIARRVKPALGKVRTDVSYWREDYGVLDEPTKKFWNEKLHLKDSDLSRHLHKVRDDAWQIAQEFSIARWWFLRSTLAQNPYYPEILQLARNSASVIDLACGFGQELRWLQADGASGDLHAVDLKEEMWNTGLQIFKEQSTKGIAFQKIDIIADERSNTNPLAEYANSADIFLLDDFLSFLGPILIENTLRSIMKASRVGTKVIGWAVGQEGDERMGMRVWGTGSRGTIHNLTTFQETWSSIGGITQTKWNIEAQLVEFEQLGFDAQDCEWFASSFFNDSLAGQPMPLKGLCFLATRLDLE